MIGNTHIDAVWLWNRAEGMQEVKSSFTSALQRMEEFPDFIFTQSSISYLDWMKENCPEQFEQIKMRVAQGRWEIVGGMWIEPDCDLPSGESLVRQFLFGKGFVKENFGVDVTTAYNVDSFGHGSNMPAVCSGCGIKYYVMSRPDKTHVKVPPVFVWKAKNGSSVIAERCGGEYMAWTRPALEWNLDESLKALEEYGYDRMAVFYGVGNHGGGPTIENIRTIYEMREEYKDLELDFSTTENFFKQVEVDKIPEVSREMGRIFWGCYSSDKKIKELNRRAEWTLVKAEIMGAMAGNLGCSDYCWPVHAKAVEKAWKETLFNQFHDVLAGTSIEPARDEACEDFSSAISAGRKVIHSQIQAIANHIDTRGEGFPLILFNPCLTEYKGVFAADVYVPRATKKQLRLKNWKGEELLYAETNYQNRAPESRKGIVFEAQIPPCGYAIYRVIPEGPDWKNNLENVKASGNVLDNGILRVCFDEKTGCPSSILKNGQELLEKGCSIKVYYDDRGSWGEDVYQEKEVGAFTATDCRELESNYIRGILRYLLAYENSEIMVDYILEKGSDCLKINLKFRNGLKHRQICMEIPVLAKEPNVVTETAFLAENKVDCFDKNTEHYQHRFADIFDVDGKGIAVLNDSTYGFRQVGSTYKLILLRNTIFARGGSGPVNEDLEGNFTNQGCYDYKFIWIPHEEALKNQRLFEEADFLHMPLEYLGDSNHPGECYLWKNSFIETKTESVHIQNVKYANEGSVDLVFRMFETEGQEGYARICCQGKQIEISLAPYEIKTLRLLGSGFAECNLLEEV